MLLADSEIFD